MSSHEQPRTAMNVSPAATETYGLASLAAGPEHFGRAYLVQSILVGLIWSRAFGRAYLVQSILVGPIWSRESKEKPGKARKVLKVAFQALLGWRRLRCNEISYTGQAAKADSCWVAAMYALACLALVAALPPVAMLYEGFARDVWSCFSCLGCGFCLSCSAWRSLRRPLPVP